MIGCGFGLGLTRNLTGVSPPPSGKILRSSSRFAFRDSHIPRFLLLPHPLPSSLGRPVSSSAETCQDLLPDPKLSLRAVITPLLLSTINSQHSTASGRISSVKVRGSNGALRSHVAIAIRTADQTGGKERWLGSTPAQPSAIRLRSLLTESKFKNSPGVTTRTV